MEETQRVRLAVLGAGYWGTKLCKEYASIQKSTSDLELCCVVDSSKPALEKMRKELDKLGFETKYSLDPNEVLNDSTIDAIHVALPNEFHYEIARKALENGKNVLIEKPIATTSREGFKLARLAEEKGMVLQVDHIFRFNNAIRTLKELLRSGKLGRVFYATLYWATYEPSLAMNRDIVFDLAPHPVDILNYLFDEWPTDVHAIGNSYVQNRVNGEDVAIINLEYPEQILAHLYLSWIHHGAKERTVKLICERGTLTCNALEQKIQLEYDHTSVEIPVFPFDLSDVISDQNTRAKNRVIGPNNTIRDMELHFISQIKKRGPQMSSGLVGARTVQVLEEITAAMRAKNGLVARQPVQKLSKLTLWSELEE